MNTKHIFTLIFSTICSTLLLAEDNNLISPEINADGTVTFRLYAPNANKAYVLGDCLIKGEDLSLLGDKEGKAKMEKDSLGVFSYTTDFAVEPEVYMYYFKVDNKCQRDSLNPYSTIELTKDKSILAVGGNTKADLYVQDGNLRGRVDTVSFPTGYKNSQRRMLVYLPECYNNTIDSLPVLYLFHGINGSEMVWTERGRVIQIYENLYAQKAVVPMIIVMPDCNTGEKLAKRKIRTNLFASMINYVNHILKGEFERYFDEITDYVEANYRVSLDPAKHAISGMSSGARQAANIAKTNYNDYSMVALLTPVVNKKQLPTAVADSIPVYWIGMGKEDFFYKSQKRYCQHFDDGGYLYLPCELESGHTWRTWRVLYTMLIQQLFKSEPLQSIECNENQAIRFE